MMFRHIVVLGITNESAVLTNANLSNLDSNFLIPGRKKELRYIKLKQSLAKFFTFLLLSSVAVYSSQTIMSLGSLILALFG